MRTEFKGVSQHIEWHLALKSEEGPDTGLSGYDIQDLLTKPVAFSQRSRLIMLTQQKGRHHMT